MLSFCSAAEYFANSLISKRLVLVDNANDFLGSRAGVTSQFAHLISNHSETSTLLTSTRSFNSGI
ncbi:hypothetical protein AA098_17660 [Pseudomonas sp. JY-Q]|nr:hypothetical protein AA098_17660 [Pseudomonas sp. JY-Q]